MKTFILEQDEEQGLVVVNDTEVLQIKVVWICLTEKFMISHIQKIIQIYFT